MAPHTPLPRKRHHQSWSLKKMALPNKGTTQMSYIEIDFHGRNTPGHLRLSKAGIRWTGRKPLDWDRIAELFEKESQK